MNVSAPTSVPDLAGLTSLLAAPPDAAVPFPGFAPPGFLTVGAGTLHTFQSTLADLLPVEGKPEQKPEEESKQREAKNVITGVTIPVQAAATTPFALAIAFLQGVVLAQPARAVGAEPSEVPVPSQLRTNVENGLDTIALAMPQPERAVRAEPGEVPVPGLGIEAGNGLPAIRLAPAVQADPGEIPAQNLYPEPAFEVEPIASPQGLVLSQPVPASAAEPGEIADHNLPAEPANQALPMELTMPAPAAKTEPGHNPVPKPGWEPAKQVQPIAVPAQASKPMPPGQRKTVASVPAARTSLEPAKAEAGNAGVPPVFPVAPPSPSPPVPRPEMAPRDRPEPLPAASEPGAGTAPEDRPGAELPHLAFVERFTRVTRPPEGQTPVPVVASSAAHPPPSPGAIPSPAGEGAPEAVTAAADGAPPAPAAGIEDRTSDRRHGNEDRRRTSSEPAQQPKSGTEPAVEDQARVEKPCLQPVAPPSAPAKDAQVVPPAASVANPAQIPHAEQEPDRLPAAPPTHPGEARTISLRVTDATEQRVELKVKDQGGELRVTVRTADADLAGSLRENLGDLVHKLEQSGFRAEAWHPAQAGSPDSRHQDSRPEGESSDHPGQQQQDSGDGRQRRQPPRKDGWMEEIENSFAPDSERSTPTWLP